MHVYNSIELLEQLQDEVKSILSQHETLQYLTHKEALLQPAPDKWSIAQVLEHLNGYNRFYLPVIEQALNHGPKTKSNEFKPGLLGDYFTKLMMPKPDGSLKKKMNTLKEYNHPLNLEVNRVLKEFEQGEHELLLLLSNATQVDIGNIKIPISISRFVKLKLGDGLRFLIAHQLRHFIQIDNVKKHIHSVAP